MTTDENIKNAIQVLYKTYESVQRLMEDCKRLSYDTNYEPVSDKFLRWRSDGNASGWLINDAVLVFQSKTDAPCCSDNGWKNGPLYSVEICLGKGNDPSYLPELIISKYEYENQNGWEAGLSPASHWAFYIPNDEKNGDFVHDKRDGYELIIPKDAKVAKTYWELAQVLTCRERLSNITSENVMEKVFGRFDCLREITVE